MGLGDFMMNDGTDYRDSKLGMASVFRRAAIVAACSGMLLFSAGCGGSGVGTSDVNAILGDTSTDSGSSSTSWSSSGSSSGGTNSSDGESSYWGGPSSSTTSWTSDDDVSDKDVEDVDPSGYDPNAMMRDVDLSLETERFDDASAELDKLLSKYKVQIYSDTIETTGSGSDVYGTRDVSCKVPSDKLSDFLSDVQTAKGIKVVSRNVNTMNVSEDLSVHEDSLEQLQGERDEYQKLLDESINDTDRNRYEAAIEKIDKRIEEVKAETQELQSDIDYTDVWISLSEEHSKTHSDMSAVSDQLSERIHDIPMRLYVIFGTILLVLIELIPWILIVALVVFVGRKMQGKFAVNPKSGAKATSQASADKAAASSDTSSDTKSSADEAPSEDDINS